MTKVLGVCEMSVILRRSTVCSSSRRVGKGVPARWAGGSAPLRFPRNRPGHPGPPPATSSGFPPAGTELFWRRAPPLPEFGPAGRSRRQEAGTDPWPPAQPCQAASRRAPGGSAGGVLV